MKSGELAALAGVTVRTLRHWHQVGVLPEPERRSNGYRTYDGADLVRVLRIKRLTALGVALEQVPGMLDATPAGHGDALDHLDRDLAARIEQLTAQRELLARVREGALAPDVPEGAAAYLARIAERSPELHAAERDQAVLLDHVLGDAGAFYALVVAEYTDVDGVAAVLEGLTDDSTPSDVEAAVEELVPAVEPVVTALARSGLFDGVPAQSSALLATTVLRSLTAGQRAVVDRMEQRFAPLFAR